jgi:hypothetical protein
VRLGEVGAVGMEGDVVRGVTHGLKMCSGRRKERTRVGMTMKWKGGI